MSVNLRDRPLSSSDGDRSALVGRDNVLRAILRAVDFGLNTLVVGAPGAGRTSVLRAVEHDLRGSGSSVPIYINAEGMEEPDALVAAVAWAIGKPILEHLPSPADVAFSAFASTTRHLGRPPGFVERLRELVHHAELGFVLLIDGLTASSLAATLFGRLRDEVLALPLTWVVAVRDADEGTILQPPADTFFARVIRLGPLTPDDAYSLAAARAGKSLPPGLLAEVVQRTELQPRSVIRLLQGLILDGVSPSEALATADERRTRLAPLSAAAQRLYALLDSRGPASASDPVLQSELGLTRGRVTNLLHDLAKAGLVVATEVRTGPGRPRKAYRVLT